MSKGDKGGSTRARSAFEFYCADSRADAVKRHDSKSFGDLSKAMSKAWRQIGAAERTRFEACAVIDRLRRELGKLRSQARKQPQKAADTVHLMANALGRAPLVARRNGVIAEALTALENIDKRMNDDGRALVAERIEPALRSPTTAATLQRVLGDAFGQRIMALFRKWWNAAANGLLRATISALPRDAAAAGAPPIQQSAARPAPRSSGVEEATRQKVRAMFKGTLVRCNASAALNAAGRSRDIEQELFEVAGARPKEYKQRARSLNFNLNAADGALLKRVAEGALGTRELIQLGTEELASESLKDQRREERERFFREEVRTEAPPKRRRDLFRRVSEVAAENDATVHETDANVAEAQVPLTDAHAPATSVAHPPADDSDSDTSESDSTSDESSAEASESEQSSSDSSDSESEAASEDEPPAGPHPDTEIGGFVLPLVIGGA
mmetsp:Transcript_18316/g.51872  ORF Transcript_18316/g.51872 Transcript_18316/m.51872 type:complete len:442 (+) Transcript_18316:94-1419(+)